MNDVLLRWLIALGAVVIVGGAIVVYRWYLRRKRCIGGTCFSLIKRESLGAFDVSRWDYDGYSGRS